jgi:membrane associated rhomboid family serine protease
VTGIGGGVLSWLVAMEGFVPIIGASGAIFGLLLAYGLLYPNRIVYLNFLLPIKVKWLVAILAGINILSSITGDQPGIAHMAHLGGLVVGFVYLKGPEYLGRLQTYRNNRRRDQLKKQCEVYYGELRRKMEDEKKGPTIH